MFHGDVGDDMLEENVGYGFHVVACDVVACRWSMLLSFHIPNAYSHALAQPERSQYIVSLC